MNDPIPATDYKDLPEWKDCHNVQCAQVHAALDSLLEWLEAPAPKEIFTVGKMVRVMDAIKARDQITSAEFVAFWDKLDFKQHCLLAAQSLLKAASLVE